MLRFCYSCPWAAVFLVAPQGTLITSLPPSPAAMLSTNVQQGKLDLNAESRYTTSRRSSHRTHKAGTAMHKINFS